MTTDGLVMAAEEHAKRDFGSSVGAAVTRICHAW